jgi:hypothetical protein
MRDSTLIGLVAVVIVGVLVDRLVAFRKRRGPRPRRRISRTDPPTPTDSLPDSAEPTARTPDPFAPPPAEQAKRTRPRWDDRTAAGREENEPPPLIIVRRRPD